MLQYLFSGCNFLILTDKEPSLGSYDVPQKNGPDLLSHFDRKTEKQANFIYTRLLYVIFLFLSIILFAVSFTIEKEVL